MSEKKIELKTEAEEKLLDALRAEEKENEILRECLATQAAWERKREEQSLKVAQDIVERDSKAVANIILNMSFDYHAHVSFCDIFKLRDKDGCSKHKHCTDCIHAFLKEYFTHQN